MIAIARAPSRLALASATLWPTALPNGWPGAAMTLKPSLGRSSVAS
jgi:hypothetical protein